MDPVQQGRDFQIKFNQIKEEVEEKSNVARCQEEQEQKVLLENLKNQTNDRQEKLKNNAREFCLLCEQERDKKRSIEQLDQQIRIKAKNIAELRRHEMSQKNKLFELVQKEHSQKRMLVMMESQAQKTAEIWKSNYDNLEKNWNCRVAEINADEERRLKNVKDNGLALRIEIGQKETVERETTRKEFGLELVKKSIAEGHAKLKKIHKLTKLVQNYRNLHQMAPYQTYHLPIPADQSLPIYPNRRVPPQPIISIQTIQSGVIPRLPPSALPAQPSQLVCQFYNQQKLQRQRLIVQDELVRRAATAINANLPSQLPLPPAIAEFDFSFNTTTTVSPSCVIPEIVQSSSSPSESTTCSVSTNVINNYIDQRPNSTNGSSVICYAPSTSKLAPKVTPVTSTLFIPEVFTSVKSSTTTSPPISFVASTLANSSTTTSKFVNSSTSPSPPTFNLDKSLNLDNGIEIITIDDSDDDDDEHLPNLVDIEYNETSNKRKEEREQRLKQDEVEKQENSQTSNEVEQKDKHRSNADFKNSTSTSESSGERRRRVGVGTSNQRSERRSKEYKLFKLKERPEQRELRLTKMRECKKQRIANETPEEREHRMAQEREWHNKKRANETPEQRERRLEQKREWFNQKRANETPKQRERRLKGMNKQQKWRIANETPEQRVYRLAWKSERRNRRIANETPEMRKCRLAKKRQYDIRRRSSQSNSNKSHVDGRSNSSFDVSDSDTGYDCDGDQSSNQH